MLSTGAGSPETDSRQISALAHVAFVVRGRILRLRAVSRGRSLAGGELFHGRVEQTRPSTPLPTGTDVLQLLLPVDSRYVVTASAPSRLTAQRWFERGELLPDPFEMELQAIATARVTVACRLDPAGSRATLAWQPIGFSPGRLDAGSVDTDGCRRFELPLGRYRLDVSAAPGAIGGARFLIPVSLDVDVPAGGVRVDVPVRYGGRIRIEARDARWQCVPGTVRLFAQGGGSIVPRLRRASGGGERAAGQLAARLPSETAAALPPGVYTIELDLGAHGLHLRTVDVREREVAEVRIDVR
jgi:hypothetical protein